jgi:hypothetical protein
MKHPIQSIYVDANGVPRFRANAIVEFLLENGGLDLHTLGMMDFSNEDREQFSQLVGYSLSGYGGLHHVSDESDTAAQQMFEAGQSEADARIEYLGAELDALKTTLKASVARLYGINPDSLTP